MTSSITSELSKKLHSITYVDIFPKTSLYIHLKQNNPGRMAVL